jgi:hypothetical protein
MHATGSGPSPDACDPNRSAHPCPRNPKPLQHRAMHCLGLVAMLSLLLANAYLSCTCPSHTPKTVTAQHAHDAERPSPSSFP